MEHYGVNFLCACLRVLAVFLRQLLVGLTQPNEELHDGGLGDALARLLRGVGALLPLVEGVLRYDVLVVVGVEERSQDICVAKRAIWFIRF